MNEPTPRDEKDLKGEGVEAVEAGEAVEADRRLPLERARSPLLAMALFVGVLTAAAAPGLWFSARTLMEGEEGIEARWRQIEAVAERREPLLAELAARVPRNGRPWPALSRWIEVTRDRREAGSREQNREGLMAEAEAARGVREQLRGRAPLPADQVEGLQARLERFERAQENVRLALNEEVERYNRHRRRIPTRWVGSRLGFPYEQGWPQASPGDRPGSGG